MHFLMAPNLIFRRISTPSTPHLHPQSGSAWNSSCPHAVTVYSCSHLITKTLGTKGDRGSCLSRSRPPQEMVCVCVQGPVTQPQCPCDVSG